MKKLYIRNQSEEMTLKELFAQFLVAKQCNYVVLCCAIPQFK
jgi:hypothetical protein